jgi:hypothetical protein
MFAPLKKRGEKVGSKCVVWCPFAGNTSLALTVTLLQVSPNQHCVNEGKEKFTGTNYSMAN